MYQNPVLVKALVRDRVAELQRSAAAGASHADGPRRPRPIATARQGAGWLLVDVGLRLAVPRGTVNQVLARGQQ